jgi:hypothetical protein
MVGSQSSLPLRTVAGTGLLAPPSRPDRSLRLIVDRRGRKRVGMLSDTEVPRSPTLLARWEGGEELPPPGFQRSLHMLYGRLSLSEVSLLPCEAQQARLTPRV